MPIALRIPGRTPWLPLLALLLLAAAPAIALAAEKESEAPEPVPVPVGQEPLPKDSVLPLLGLDVKGTSAKGSAEIVVGQVVNVLVDGNGAPRGVVLDYGGFLGVGKRRIAVAWPMFRFSPKGAVLSLTRDQLKAFPEYRKDEDTVMATAPAEAP